MSTVKAAWAPGSTWEDMGSKDLQSLPYAQLLEIQAELDKRRTRMNGQREALIEALCRKANAKIRSARAKKPDGKVTIELEEQIALEHTIEARVAWDQPTMKTARREMAELKQKGEIEETPEQVLEVSFGIGAKTFRELPQRLKLLFSPARVLKHSTKARLVRRGS